MKRIYLYILATLLPFLTLAQANKSNFNQKLADSLKADAYGMKMYMLVILKTGPTEVKDSILLDSLFKGHMNNIQRLAKIGSLVVAGPLKKNEKSYRGIFILNVATKEEAQILLVSDPAIKAGIFETELYPWYGSAALPMYMPYHDMIQKESF